MTAVIEMTLTQCYKCGIAFFVPDDWLACRRRDHRELWCPNGHGQVFIPEADGARKAKSMEDRQELVLAIHRAEQAEARAAEATGLVTAEPPAPAPAASVEQPVEDEELPDVPGVKIIGRRMICPHCQKGYKLGQCFAKHLRAEHEDTALAEKVRGRVMR